MTDKYAYFRCVTRQREAVKNIRGWLQNHGVGFVFSRYEKTRTFKLIDSSVCIEITNTPRKKSNIEIKITGVEECISNTYSKSRTEDVDIHISQPKKST